MGMVVYLRSVTDEDVARLAGDPDQLDEFMFADDGGTIDFDKAWHALHFMLTGDAGRTDDPASVLVTDDAHLLGTDENGFGGYWLIPPKQVQAFATQLDAMSDDELAARFDPVEMDAQQLYLSDVFVEEGDEALPYIMQGVPALRKLARDAARANAYIIGSLN